MGLPTDTQLTERRQNPINLTTLLCKLEFTLSRKVGKHDLLIYIGTHAQQYSCIDYILLANQLNRSHKIYTYPQRKVWGLFGVYLGFNLTNKPPKLRNTTKTQPPKNRIK